MTDKTLLHPGDPFAALMVSLPGGRTVHLPGDLAGHFGVRLFYWESPTCPFLQSACFVVDPRPGHRQLYSSGAIARLVPPDVIGLVRYLCGHARSASPNGRRRAQRDLPAEPLSMSGPGDLRKGA
jgi:hypothetical protein